MMMNYKTRSLILLVLLLILFSCKDPKQADKAIEVFFLGVLQVINLILIGVTAMVMCVLAYSNGKEIFRILGWVFLILFSLFTLMGFISVIKLNPRNPEIFYVFIIELIMIVVCLVFIIIKPNTIAPSKKQSGKNTENQIVDDEVI